MKGYKLLVPFALAALFAVSVYMAVNTNMEKEETYNRQGNTAARAYWWMRNRITKWHWKGSPLLHCIWRLGIFIGNLRRKV